MVSLPVAGWGSRRFSFAAVEAGGGAALKRSPQCKLSSGYTRQVIATSRFALCADLAASLNDPTQLDGLAQVIAEHGDARTLLTIGKTAVQRGYRLDMHAFPLRGVPGLDLIDGTVEKAMAYAIARQESAFSPDVQSSAGARGLMQLMPETARRTAKRLGIEFDLERLLDPEYNAKLGVAHLGELSEDWKGSSSPHVRVL